jgi:pimeloyl-ACP methyl ester carboxylesterase
MKKLLNLIKQLKTDPPVKPDELNDLIWQLICYAPKMSLRLQQEQLIAEAEKFSLTVNDEYFAHKELVFNGFKWGTGSRKVLITHGWGSKAADFMEMIISLRAIGDLEIIAFDAPGNGRSEGELSNLLLFMEAVKATILNFGEPDIVIGHSLGGMANSIILNEMNIKPSLLISIAPLIRLKENFEASMDAAGVAHEAQASFLKSFEDLYKKPASYYNLHNRYLFGEDLNHWLAYDKNDRISTFDYMSDFLREHPSIKNQSYEDVGHDRIIKSPQVIDDVVNLIRKN